MTDVANLVASGAVGGVVGCACALVGIAFERRRRDRLEATPPTDDCTQGARDP